MFKFKKPNNALESGALAGNAPAAPDDIYVSCPSCKNHILSYELYNNFSVCEKCEHHFTLSPRQRIKMLCDEGSFKELFSDLTSKNPLSFPDYEKKLDFAMSASREKEAVLTGTCTIDDMPVCIFVMNGAFMMGSMGSVVGEKITRLFEFATENRLPVLGFTVSGGARMQEGIISLMQMAKTSGAVKRHSDASLLYITVLTNPTTGGVTASFAMEGDIIIAEPKALICFAGPRVVEETTKQKLPDGFQRAEFLLEKGFVDLITHRSELRKTLAKLLNFHREDRA